MTYALTRGTAVIRLADGAVIPDDPRNADRAAFAAWLAAGGIPEAAPPATMADYQAALDSHVEAVAASRGYKNAAQCRAYANSTVPAWAAEASAFSAWQDRFWLAVYAELAKVETGAEPPNMDALMGRLPVIAWPA